MSKSADPKVSAAAHSTLLGTRGMRVQRQLVGGVRRRMPTGTLRRTVYDAQNDSRLPGRIVRGEGAAAINDKAADEAYDGAGLTYVFYKEVLKRDSVDGRGMRLDSTVHYQEDPPEGFDNAFWNGDEMVYGDGDGVLFGRFTQSVDIIGHELTHGVTQFEADLEYHNQSGALNESFSDVFGSMILQYSKKQTIQQANWLIGEHLFIAKGSALRNMKAPGTAYDIPELGGKDPQPAHMKDFAQLPDTRRGDNGGVHINSGIPNRAFYEACKNLGKPYSWDQAGPIWYDTLCKRLSSRASFEDAKTATIDAANALYGAVEAKAVRAAWETVGV